MADQGLHVRAQITLLRTDEGGRETPVMGSYRPNHNFFGAENRNMAVGFIEVPQGQVLHPGESIKVELTFFPWPQLAAELRPGRQWLIQEGATVVGTGTILEVLG